MPDFYNIRKAYRMTQEEYLETLAKQNNVCAICGKPDTISLAVDHNHKCCPERTSCGKCLRGLLCKNCNNLLGLADDNADLLLRAVEYLRFWAASPRPAREPLPPLPHGNKGWNFSDEHRRNLSLAHKGRLLSEDHRRKLREAHARRLTTPEGIALQQAAARRPRPRRSLTNNPSATALLK
jgi:hypothetical protein